MIVEVFITQAKTVYTLGDQVLDRMFDQIGITVIGEAGGETGNYPCMLFDLAQEHPAAIRTDRAAVKASGYIAGIFGLKSLLSRYKSNSCSWLCI